MKLNNFKKYFRISLLGLAVMLGVAGISNAQGNRDDNNNQDRYRVRRGNQTYNTDNRGADLLRQAVNEGYRQGFQAGQDDRRRRHRNNWRGNGIYRAGNQGYDTHVDSGQYRYYFQQGFQKGYDDGYNSRTRYGSNNSILGSILNQIFRPERY
jgi:flagellar biosynthesis/type III secretory pathway protein FliH